MSLTPQLTGAGRARRAQYVTAQRALYGLSFVDLLDTTTTTMVLELHFLPAADGGVPPGLEPNHVLLVAGSDGTGAEYRAIEVVPKASEHVARATIQLDANWEDQTTTRVFTVVLQGLRDVDPAFREAELVLGVDSDIETAIIEPSAYPPQPVDLDYLNKDYESFRALLLSHMATRLPEWTERHVPDLGVLLIELMAYAGDYLSYYQDAVVTEGYLGTARRRASVARHARLLDYSLSEGTNARVWIAVQLQEDDGPAAAELFVPQGMAFWTAAPGASEGYGPALPADSRVFNSMHPARLRSDQNQIPLYNWGAPDFVLPAGSTRAALCGHRPGLERGSVLVLARLSTATGSNQWLSPVAVRLIEDAETATDPATGQEITLVRWHVADALPTSLPAFDRQRRRGGIALGNILLADDGRPADWQVEADDAVLEPWYPWFDLPGPLTWAVPTSTATLLETSASESVLQDPARAVGAVEVQELQAGRPQGLPWGVRQDLLESDSWSREVAVEVSAEKAGFWLRFGDGVNGIQPTPGVRFRVRGRYGNGTAGNVAQHTIQGWDDRAPIGDGQIVSVDNPLPALGGTDPEPLQQAVRNAPQAFRQQERCVTMADWTARARQQAGVADAVAVREWTGSWWTVAVYIQLRGGEPLPQTFAQALHQTLSRYLLAGTDLQVRDPRRVPIEIRLRITLDPHAVHDLVRSELTERFGTGRLPNGTPAFFAPDQFTFGQPLVLSQVVAAATDVVGVDRVTVERFRIVGTTTDWTAHGRIPIGPTSTLEVAGDRRTPDRGSIAFVLEEP